ncbi:hypothetical protein Verru16b_00289 [Lacunisphaera limnophila]|uniref:Uncharacterized protein n=1 Tax=Lacunisphaera limnophila TaxID=1838286 RepID=A0A1I7PHZ5_9BACT|nr:hypothetical protein [Lacunisphaera limnophila]AOS43246.1 hypothetical protein Verru16b_00289 [Lacunisphaera limnophila]
MSSSEIPASPSQPNAPTPPAAPTLSAADAETLLNRPRALVTVLCPTGFTPYATEGVDLSQPLFARVTYRPE